MAWRWLVFGGVVVLVTVSLVLSVSAGGGGLNNADGIPRAALNYAGNHTTLWGRIAALSHFDVLKTTEPLTCSDGAANFTCLLSKTDVKPVVAALRGIGVELEVERLNDTWVLVLHYNYTAGQWQWLNYTTQGAWELKWNNQTARIYQTKIRKALGEVLKVKDKIIKKYLSEELKGITMVGVVRDRVIIGTLNGTKGKVDEEAVRKIREKIREVDSEIEAEVVYVIPEPARGRSDEFNPLVGGVQIVPSWTTDVGTYNTTCTLGFVGSWGNTPVLTTAWHCIAWTFTVKTQGNAYIYQPVDNLVSNRLAATCSYVWESDSKLIVTCDIIPMRLLTQYDPKVFRPDVGVAYGQVIRKYCKYDVTKNTLLAKAGVTTDVTKGYIKSYNVDVTYSNQKWGSKTFTVVVKYLVSTTIYVEGGDSGSPVFTYEGAPDRLGAYAIVSGRARWFGFFYESYVQNLCDLPFIFDPTR